MKRLVLCLMIVLASHVARAEDMQPCAEGVLDALAAAAHVDGDAVAAACKALPDDPHTTIAVAAYGDPEADSKEQVLGLIDAGTSRVLALHRETVEEDATVHVGPYAYSIDTARYRLTPQLRAFGVVFHSDAPGPSCPDANAGSELTLWVREGKVLRPVLGTNLNGWTSVRGTACSAGHGDAAREDATLTLAMEKTSTHGYADISLTAHIKSSHRTADDRWLDGPQRSETTLLRYDGKSYGTDMFRSFWYPATSE